MRRMNLMILVVLCFFLIGCKKNGAGDNEKNIDSFGEDSHIITWVYLFYPGISIENQREINRILQEKGIDYQIQFILPIDGEGNPLTGAEYAGWLDNYEKKRPLDIISSSVWPAGTNSDLEFIRKRMAPLNSCLETDDGKVLRSFFTEEEWKGCSLDGNAYVIPQPVIGNSDDYGLDLGVYAAVNKKYEEYFNSFDGTYESLKNIYNSIGDKDLRIVLPYLPGAREVYGLMGYSTLQNALPLSIDENRVLDITKTNEVQNILQNLYMDMKSGILIIQSWEPEINEDQILAYIYTKKKKSRIGFKEYLIAPGIIELNLRGKYGISVNSERKDQAFQILAMCFSDPDILCLLYPGVDKDLILNRKGILSNEISEVTGINLSFDEKQAELVQVFPNAFSNLVNSLQRRKTNAEDGYYYELNSTVDIKLEWKKFMENMDAYSDLCESANQQIEKWGKDNVK